MKNRFLFLIIAFLFCSTAGLLSYSSVYSEDLQGQVMDQLNSGVTGAGLQIQASGENDIRLLIMQIIRILLGALGTIFLALVFYAGYLFVTSNGDEEKVKKAGSIVKGAILGLVIVLFSYSITLFIGTNLTGNEVKQINLN